MSNFKRSERASVVKPNPKNPYKKERAKALLNYARFCIYAQMATLKEKERERERERERYLFPLGTISTRISCVLVCVRMRKKNPFFLPPAAAKRNRQAIKPLSSPATISHIIYFPRLFFCLALPCLSPPRALIVLCGPHVQGQVEHTTTSVRRVGLSRAPIAIHLYVSYDDDDDDDN